MEGHVSYSHYKMELEEAVSDPRSSSIGGFDVGLDFTYFYGKDELKYGIELVGFKTEYQFENSSGLTIEQVENTTELGFYAKYKWIKGKFIVEPSFRMQWYASLSEMSPEPRLAIKYNATKSLRFKLAGGFYSQNLISARSDRDVVNLFYGFLSGPENLPKTYDDDEVTSKLQKATHIIVGLEYDLSDQIAINLEGYYKKFNQLTNLNRNKMYEDDEDNVEQPDLLKKDFVIEEGDAQGVDFTLSYNDRKYSLWAVYSYSIVNRYYENIEGDVTQYYPHFDRRHNVNLVGTWKFGGKLDWEFSARWNFGTGFPFTQTQGYYEKITFNQGIYTDYINQNGDLELILAELNEGRMPDYHRLDFNLKKKFLLSENSTIEIDFSVINVYNRENVFYRDRITQEIVYQLPIIPSLGVSWRF